MEGLLGRFRKLWLLVRRDKFNRELDEEMAFHREQAEAEFQSEGLAPDAAGFAAKKQFGNATRLKEQSREIIGFRFETAIQDLRYAFRQLRHNPGFACAAIIILGLGIGATTAIFSALNPILFEPLPYPQAGRITAIWETGSDRPHIYGTFGMYRALEERAHSFDSLAVLRLWQPTLTGADHPERLAGQRVTPGYFRVLGVSPSMGRDFQSSDDLKNGPRVVMISHGLWLRRFGSDRTIIGRQITLSDDSYSVIGVMPSDFDNVMAPGTDVWAPLRYEMSDGPAWGHHLRTVGRLKPGVEAGQAALELNLLGAQVLKEKHPETYGRAVKFAVTLLQDDVTRSVKPALLAVLGAVLLVLAIGCVNVTNLLLARSARRRGEFALRSALGAGRTRLLRQMFTESLLLALLGGAAGMAVAVFGVRALLALSPAGLPRAAAIGVNPTAFAFGLGITTLVGLAFGLAPALHAASGAPHDDLRNSSRGTAGTHLRTRSILVVTEVALALVLLVTSGLLLRSLDHLFAVDSGFDSVNMLTMQIQTNGHRFDDSKTAFRFFDDALAAAGGVPGVESAALTSQLPLSGDVDEYGAHFEATPTEPAVTYSVFRYAVSPGYIEAMRIPLLRGRVFTDTDADGAPLVALISESLARARFPAEDPIGHRLRVGPRGPFTIVGVVGDVKQQSLAGIETAAVYITPRQFQMADDAMSLIVRSTASPATLIPALKNAIWSVDKDQPIVRVASMSALLSGTAADRRFALVLFEAFALVALVLAAAGIYGVLAGSVAERTREIGVRTALGASRRSILALVVRQGMMLSGLGVVIGLAGAAAASQAIAAMLFGVSRLDPVTYVAVIALLLAVSALACAVPARRAASVNPIEALRAE
jgi:putative ABC transport system permease protein